MFRVCLLLGFVIFALQACTVLSSQSPEHFDKAEQAASGYYYSLPKGIVTVTLSVNEANGKFVLTVSAPEFIADGDHQYFLKYRSHPGYTDDIKITMNTDTNKPFLGKVSSTTTDQSKTILLNLVRALTFGNTFQTAGHGSNRILAKLPIDISDDDAVKETRTYLNWIMNKVVRENAIQCRRYPPLVRETIEVAACSTFSSLMVLAEKYRRRNSGDKSRAGAKPLIEFAITKPRVLPFTKKADCRVGICYRPKLPFGIYFSVAGAFRTKIVELPNRSNLVEIDIRRAFLVKKVQDITFDTDGFFTTLHIQKDSEMLEAAKLPLEVAGAVAEGLALRVKLLGRQQEDLNSQKQLVNSISALRAREASVLATLQTSTGSGSKSNSVGNFVVKPKTVGNSAKTGTTAPTKPRVFPSRVPDLPGVNSENFGRQGGG